MIPVFLYAPARARTPLLAWQAGGLESKVEWKHGCAVWQHCFTRTGLINSEAIKNKVENRWGANDTLPAKESRRSTPEKRSFYCCWPFVMNANTSIAQSMGSAAARVNLMWKLYGSQIRSSREEGGKKGVATSISGWKDYIITIGGKIKKTINHFVNY